MLSNSSALLFIYLFIYLFARYHDTITLDSYYSFHHTIHLSYRSGFLFPLDYSLFSMTAVSNSSWNASLLKELHTVPLPSRIRWFCMILKIMLFSQYLRLHMTIICWRFCIKTPFNFSHMCTLDMWKGCLQTFRNNRIC